MKIIFLILTISNLYANTNWFYGPKKLDIVFLKEDKVFISKECLNSKSTCLAYQAINNRLPRMFSNFGGVNPGSKICSEKLLSKVFIATDEEGGTEAFCLFKDQSFVSLGGLWK